MVGKQFMRLTFQLTRSKALITPSKRLLTTQGSSPWNFSCVTRAESVDKRCGLRSFSRSALVSSDASIPIGDGVIPDPVDKGKETVNFDYLKGDEEYCYENGVPDVLYRRSVNLDL